MEIVVDANIVFSFFKKDTTPRELILDSELRYNLRLFAPELALEEINKHKNDVCSRFKISPKDFEIMFSSLPLFIKIVKKDTFKEYISKAKEILAPHIKDVPYAALSLSFKSKGYEIALWSNEERLRILEKYGIKVYSTSKLLKELGLKQ